MRREGKDPQEYVSGRACDSYRRYEEDFDIARELKHTSHRFSLEWSRIEPEEGKFDHEQMAHYVQVADALRERGMEPMVTLWHFTNPAWFSRKGGFLHPDSPRLFERYVRYVVGNLKGRVNLWITFNEALTVYATLAYLRGAWPPQKRDLWAFRRFQKQIIEAHTLAYRVIKNAFRQWPPLGEASEDNTSHNVTVGIVENVRHIVAGRFLEKTGLASLVRWFFYDRLFKRLTSYTDFWGLNYYTIRRLPGSFGVLPKQPEVPEMNWEIYPEGMYRVLMRLKKFGKPIYVTENGISDASDERREQFIGEHLSWIRRAVEEGVDVRGYFHWSLLDSFEWHRGFGPRFGLVEVDYRTLKRTIRPSARAYATMIQGT